MVPAKVPIIIFFCNFDFLDKDRDLLHDLVQLGCNFPVRLNDICVEISLVTKVRNCKSSPTEDLRVVERELVVQEGIEDVLRQGRVF